MGKKGEIMIEQEIIRDQEFIAELTEGERPLVDKWVTNCTPIFRRRERLVEQLASGSVDMPVPDFLIPIMNRWAKDGPVILCSYAHPEEFEMYKFMANLNLAVFMDRMEKNGIVISPDQVVENWYETVALSRNVLTPLRFGDTFPLGEKFSIQHDLFGLGNAKSGLEDCDFPKQFRTFRDIDCQAIGQGICDRLSMELESELVSLNLTKDKRRTKREAIRDLLAERLRMVISIAEIALDKTQVDRDKSVNGFLMNIEQKFAGHLLDPDPQFGLSARLEGLTGIKGTLFSRNTRWLNLVFDTLDILVAAKGPIVLKEMVGSIGDGLFAGSKDGKDLLLTVDKDQDQFISMNKSSFETEEVVADDEVMTFVKDQNFLPLAKAETLAIIAGGMTFHMGSEHGARQKVLSVLGIEQDIFPEFFDYLSGMRIGEDLEQGNNLFAIKGGQSIPAVLAFVLFGKEFLRSRMLEKAGVDFEPEILRERELKKLFAMQLVESLDEEDLSGLNTPFSHAGFLWG